MGASRRAPVVPVSVADLGHWSRRPEATLISAVCSATSFFRQLFVLPAQILM